MQRSSQKAPILRSVAPVLVLAASTACGKPAMSPASGAGASEAADGNGAAAVKPSAEAHDAAAGGLSARNAAGYRWGVVKMGGGGFVSGLIPPRDRAGAWYART